MTPTETVDHALDLLIAHDMPAFADLFEHDGVMEFPLATGGAIREVRGRDALHDYLDDYASLLDIRSLDRTVHVTTDPEVVIVEFTVDGVIVATDRPYRMVYIAVITVRDDAIVRYRDYWNPAAVVDIVGSDARLAGGRAS